MPSNIFLTTLFRRNEIDYILETINYPDSNNYQGQYVVWNKYSNYYILVITWILLYFLLFVPDFLSEARALAKDICTANIYSQNAMEEQ